MHDQVQLNIRWLRGLINSAAAFIGKKFSLGLIVLSLSACMSQTTAGPEPIKSGKNKTANTAIEHLNPDTAKALAAFKNKARLCQPAVLTIYYAFGQSKLEIKANATRCMLLIKAYRELSEREKPIQLDCTASTIHEIDWLNEQAPPIEALSNLKNCRTIK